MGNASGPRFPFELFSFTNRNKDLEELRALTSTATYDRLRDALVKVSELEAIPLSSNGSKSSKKRERVRIFLTKSGFNKSLVRRLAGIYADESDKRRRMRTIKAVEARVALGFLDKSGFGRYDTPALAFAGEKDMLFHAFADQSGAPNQGAIAADEFHEVYEMYSVDIGPVLSEQGRYNLFCGYVELESKAADNVVKARFMQPSGAAPGGIGLEEYTGYFFLQDDTGYIMSFKAGEDEGLDDELKDLLGPGAGLKATPKGQRKNLAVLVLNGLSRSADGLYDKFVGGQIGRGLTGATGVLASPCVLYRVTDGRIKQIEDVKVARAEYDGEIYRRRFPTNQEISARDKAAFYKTEVIGSQDIISGVDLDYVSVMSDLNIPVPRQSGQDERHVDVNVFNSGN
jgi:hypothetical protein